jgi:hypothetical protein
VPVGFTPARVTCAPGNVVTVPVTGMVAGPATMTWSAQGGARNVVFALPYVAPSTPPPYPPLATDLAPCNVATDVPAPEIVVTPATATGGPTGLALVFTVPDGLQTDVAAVVDSEGNAAPLAVSVVSQYVQAADYIGAGEGGELDPVFATMLAYGPNGSELDRVLRRAAALVDMRIGGTCRLLQYDEKHRLGVDKQQGRLFYPFHTSPTARPLVSLDYIAYVTSNQLSVVFQATDFYVNPDLGYVMVLANTFGTFVLASVYQSIGYSAQVVEILVTTGFPDLLTPDPIREAVMMTATAFLNSRKKELSGLGGLKQVETGLLVSDGQQMAMPQAAKDMLRPFVKRSVR